MKNSILILISLLFLTGCSNKYVEVIKESPYTERVWETYKNGRDGQKKKEIYYKEGKLDGLYTEWYENGYKGSEGNFKDGKKNGLYTEWYENGQKKGEVNFKNEKLDGLWTGWYRNGQKKGEVNFKNGLMEVNFKDGLVYQ